MNTHMTLIDCTLRDGSYAVDFQWTADDTRRICSGLQDAGVTMIEIGHGVGINGSCPRYGVAAATDDDYWAAAAAVLRAAQFGSFFIPTIGRLDDLNRARSAGMGFIRIGSDVTAIARSRDAVRHAKRLGFHVSLNAMKSYVVEPPVFARAMSATADWGVDALYLVDSAGCMLPEDVARYISELRALTVVELGFHGHNNLTLASANCIAAYGAGATLLDATLQGIGRGGGNAQSEAVVAIFERLGVSTNIDLMTLLSVGEQLVAPRQAAAGVTSLDVAMGMGGFHSSFLPRINSVVERIPVDAKCLIMALGAFDRLNPSEQLIEEIARAIAAPVVGQKRTLTREAARGRRPAACEA